MWVKVVAEDGKVHFVNLKQAACVRIDHSDALSASGQTVPRPVAVIVPAAGEVIKCRGPEAELVLSACDALLRRCRKKAA